MPVGPKDFFSLCLLKAGLTDVPEFYVGAGTQTHILMLVWWAFYQLRFLPRTFLCFSGNHISTKQWKPLKGMLVTVCQKDKKLLPCYQRLQFYYAVDINRTP